MPDFGTWYRKIIEMPIAKFSSIQSQNTRSMFKFLAAELYTQRIRVAV